MERVTRVVNGGTNALAEREVAYKFLTEFLVIGRQNFEKNIYLWIKHFACNDFA